MDDNEAGAEQEKITMEENNLRQKSEVVWKEAGPVMEDWENRLTSFEEKHRTQIAKSLNNIAHLFGKEAPEKTKVDLHYLATENSSKGEPASGLVNAMRLPEGDTDVFYWVGKFIRLPNDGPEQIEQEERLHTTKVIHEVIHQDFQGQNEVFKGVLEAANADEEVLQLRKELMQNQASYLEPEAELTAIYLDQYANKLLQEESVGGVTSKDESMIEYRIDEKRFHEVFKAVVKEDESWESDGPYTAARRGWGVADVRPVQDVQEAGLVSEPSIYKLGEKITDFSLIERYTLENKQLDLNFVKELYKTFLDQRTGNNSIEGGVPYDTKDIINELPSGSMSLVHELLIKGQQYVVKEPNSELAEKNPDFFASTKTERYLENIKKDYEDYRVIFGDRIPETMFVRGNDKITGEPTNYIFQKKIEGKSFESTLNSLDGAQKTQFIRDNREQLLDLLWGSKEAMLKYGCLPDFHGGNLIVDSGDGKIYFVDPGLLRDTKDETERGNLIPILHRIETVEAIENMLAVTNEEKAQLDAKIGHEIDNSLYVTKINQLKLAKGITTSFN